MHFFTLRIKIIAFVTVLLLIAAGANGQAVVDTGREAAKTSIDLSALAAYYAAHPAPPLVMQLENEDDDEIPPVRPPADPGHVRYRAMTTYLPASLLPISPAPTDTFESTLDNGTSIPPDTHGAVDSNYCMTTINTTVHIQTRAGVDAIAPVSLNAFWASITGPKTYDPRIHYDPNYHRWIFVTDDSAQSNNSCLLIAVSKTSNPTGAWWMYRVDINAPSYWLDYPDVGFNGKWVVVTGNLFKVTGSGYGGCKVFAFDYVSMMTGAGAPFTAFTQASSSCINPTSTYDPALNSIFAVESWDGSAGGGGQMRLWKITGAVGSETMTTVAYPAAAGYNWQSQGNGGSDFAPQTGTANLIQTNDDRVFSCQYINGKIWCSHSVFSPATGATTRCSAQWWQIDTFGTPVQIGLIDDPTNTNFFAFPSIAANATDDALIGFSQFSANTHPNAGYAVRFHTDPADSMRPYQVYRHGQNTYYKDFGSGRCRWGDYSAVNVDPLNMTDFWTIQEASASAANTWDTWWAYVNMCNITAAITPSGPTTFCAGGSVTLTATSGAGYTYQWKTGSTVIAGATNITYSATTSGNYTVVITSGCSTTSPVMTVSVNPLPAAIGGSLNACVGGTTNLTDGSGPGTWSSGTTTVATVVPATGVVSGAGPGTSVITFTLGTGCATTATVTVSALPAATITAGGATTFCAGSSVTLNATSGAGFTYQWKLGGAVIPGATAASYVASAAGNYTVVVTNAAGCSATSAATSVTVNPVPTAITGTLSFCVGATTTLNSTPAGGSWGTSNPAVATVTGGGVVTGMGTGGLANITYTLGTGCFTTSVVTVNSTAAAPISGPSSVCVTRTVTLTDGTPGGAWSSTNPTVASIGSTGVVTGVATGTATISYVAATSCGTATATTTIVVNPIPVVAAITGTVTVCNGGASTLSDATPLGVWSSSNNAVATVGSSSGIVTGASIGTDTIYYTVTNGFGCATAATATVNVFAPFTATVTAGGPTSFCSGGNVALNAATAPGYNYRWNRNGVIIPGATNPTYIANATGDYTVDVYTLSGCNSLSAITTVSVNPLPIDTPSVNILANPGFQICITPAPVTFTAIPAHGGSAPAYQWFVGGTPVGGGSSYTYTPSPGQVISCTLTSNDICAITPTASQSDTITLLTAFLTPSVSISANTTAGIHKTAICLGDTVKFSAVPVYGGTAPTYLWTKNGINVATGPDYIYIPVNGDTLYVTMTSNHPCVAPAVVSSSISYRVAVYNHVGNAVNVTVSQSSIVAGSVDTFTAVAINGGSSPAFQWLRNGVVIPGATASRYITGTLVNGDVISCMETSNAACASPVTVISGGIRVVVNSDGMQRLTAVSEELTIIPNPNRGEFSISGKVGDNGDEPVKISITDMLGQTIYTKSVVARSGKLDENVTLGNSLANGIYLLCVTTRDGRSVYHVVVSR